MPFELGQRASATRTFTAGDLEGYRRLTRDEDPRYAEARAEGFEGPVVPGMLLGGMISRLLGLELPGRGTNWMKQRLTFVAPARLGEAVTAQVEIVRLRPEKDLVNLRTTCTGADGRLLMDGEALVMAREMFDPAARTGG